MANLSILGWKHGTSELISFPDDDVPPLHMDAAPPKYGVIADNECDVVGICGSDSTTTCTPSPTPGQVPTCGCATGYESYNAVTKTCTGEHTHIIVVVLGLEPSNGLFPQRTG